MFSSDLHPQNLRRLRLIISGNPWCVGNQVRTQKQAENARFPACFLNRWLALANRRLQPLGHLTARF